MNNAPISVGGIGGSGTRVIASILMKLGYFIGSDLPPTQDTVWYALFFGRRDVLLDDGETFTTLMDLFFRQMAAPQPLNGSETELVLSLANQIRHQHNPQVLDAWAESFIKHSNSGKAQDLWGWKVPYTHVLIDRLLAYNPDLKYVHISRNGLDMAYSRNQNQLGKWGPIYLNRNVEMTPSDSLSFWCSVHRRMAKITDRFPDRIFHLNYDDLIVDPASCLRSLMQFLDADISPANLEELCSMIVAPSTVGRHLQHDDTNFRPEDLEYLAQLPVGGRR